MSGVITGQGELLTMVQDGSDGGAGDDEADDSHDKGWSGKGKGGMSWVLHVNDNCGQNWCIYYIYTNFNICPPSNALV